MVAEEVSFLLRIAALIRIDDPKVKRTLDELIVQGICSWVEKCCGVGRDVPRIVGGR